jgi:3-oxoacyl-[acyl-carrier protein] reductase
MPRLDGKVAIVTGAAAGQKAALGSAFAKALAAEGAKVVVADVKDCSSVAAEIAAKGGMAHPVVADVRDAKSVTAMIAETEKTFGRLDILVNNAGVFVTGKVQDRANNGADIERQFDVNVGGVAAAVRAAAGVLGEGGRIISIGSVLGDTSPWPGIADYSATKAAVAAYTRGWARDLAPKGITVNNAQPGPIDTVMNPASGEFAEAQKAATALGRFGKPEEVAAAVVFLARPEASFITGATLNVDGGFSV